MKPKTSPKSSKPALFEKLVFKIASKWVAGYSINDALKSAKMANSNGMNAIINYLGEHRESLKDIEAGVKEYLTILDEMEKLQIKGGISPKLTQIGLEKDYDLSINNASRIIELAKQLNRFVWLDMESSLYLNDTIEIYLRLLNHYHKVGLAFQAYLKNASDRLIQILVHGGKVRLVKGAYREDSNVVFRSKYTVDRNYSKLMRLLFQQGKEFAIATHDQKLIEEAIKLSKKYPKKFEFQMLKGIRDDLKPALIKQGFSLSEYIPYGKQVIPYSFRRIKEKPSNILLLARSLF
ncbi:MAG: proline dehydrogenase family protein [Nitrososphaerales archaeon]